MRSWIERRDPALARAIGPGDFAVAAGDLEAAIDLVAVCTLEE